MSCIGQSNLKEKRGYKEKGMEDVKKQKYLFFYENIAVMAECVSKSL